VPDQLELVVFEQMFNVITLAGKEVIQAGDVVTILQQTLAQVGTKEASATGYQDLLACGHEMLYPANGAGEMSSNGASWLMRSGWTGSSYFRYLPTPPYF
jgi:hypothetical protein